MTCGHLMAHRDPVQREGQGQLQDPERPLPFRVAGAAVPKVGRKGRTGTMPLRITRKCRREAFAWNPGDRRMQPRWGTDPQLPR